MAKKETRTQIGKGGRIVVPAKLRKELDISTGDELVVLLEEDSIRLIPIRKAVKLAQERVKKYNPEGRSLVEELIQARREEARDE